MLFEPNGVFFFLQPGTLSNKEKYLHQNQFAFGQVFIYESAEGGGRLRLEMQGLKPLFPHIVGSSRCYEAFLKAASLRLGRSPYISVGIFNADEEGKGRLYYEFDLKNVGFSTRPITDFDGLVLIPEGKELPAVPDWKEILKRENVVAYGKFFWERTSLEEKKTAWTRTDGKVGRAKAFKTPLRGEEIKIIQSMTSRCQRVGRSSKPKDKREQERVEHKKEVEILENIPFGGKKRLIYTKKPS